MMTRSPGGRLRFAVVCQSLSWSAWELKCVEQALSLDALDLVGLILPARSPAGSGADAGNKRRAIGRSGRAYDLFQKVFRPRSLNLIDVSRRFEDVPRLGYPPAHPDGIPDGSTPEVREQFMGKHLDFILYLSGFREIPGDLRETARLGVWSFDFGGGSGFSAGLATFWDILEAKSTSVARLMRLPSKSGSGADLRRAVFRTMNHSYGGNTDHVHDQSSSWVRDVCRDFLAQDPRLFYRDSEAEASPSTRIPGGLQVLRFWARLFKNKLDKLFRDSLMLDQWNIGVIDRPIDDIIEGDSPLAIRWLLAPSRKEAFADPFPIRSPRSFVMFENFDQRQDKGIISVTALGSPEEQREISVSLEKPHHLSYPFVFEHEGEVYMIPEEWLTNRITLYKAVHFPSDWRPVSVLVDDIAAVDATLFRHDGFWWLFCSPKEDDFAATLLVFYARDLLGPWQPHVQNPVKCDVRSSRPGGGLFRCGDMIIRPAQDSSRSYGGGITLNRVVELSPGKFREDTIKALKPDAGDPFDKGIHTINPIGNVVVVDGKRHLFSFAHFRHQIRKKAPRVTTKAGRGQSFQIISAPKKKEKECYREAIAKVTETLARIPGTVAVFQLGGIDNPGISDLDLLAVFEDSLRVEMDPRPMCAGLDRYLFTHNLSAISRSDFLETGRYDVWYRLGHLWGEELAPLTNAQSPIEAEAIRRQTALEFLTENYIDLTIQRRYRVLKLRSTLQHIKAIRLDLELLGITSGPVFEMVHQVRRWLGRWFENPIGKIDLWNWMAVFYAELETLLTAEIRRSPLYIPSEGSLRFGRNIALRNADSLGHGVSGLSFPPHIIGLNRKLFNLNSRLNFFVFDIPQTPRPQASCLEDRYNFHKRIKRTVRTAYPHFDPFITGFSSKIVP